MPPSCDHTQVLLDVSEYGQQIGFKPAQSGASIAMSSSYAAAPLVLPGDALTDTDENEPQTYKDFVNDEDRNEVTPGRKTLYLVAPPSIDASASYMLDWVTPTGRISSGARVTSAGLHQRVKEYTAAFYHGMPVKMFEGKLTFLRHNSDRSRTPKKVDLLYGDGNLLDVRTRSCPDKAFSRQLNLNDLLDVLIAVLPDDAYAMMMLVDHDIWEEDDDIFQCGRAYGASRVAVVSTARYNPALDGRIGLELEHAWPASHCAAFVETFIAEHEEPARSQKKTKVMTKRKVDASQPTPLHRAVAAYRDTLSKLQLKTTPALERMWLSRIYRTVTHELGHCLGVDHCTYYACLMQATAGLLEDSRQPLYACMVDEIKLDRAIGNRASERDAAMLRLLQGQDWTDDPTFAAMEAWLRSMSEQ